MSRIKWTPPSVKDLDRLFKFLKNKNPNAAKKAASQIKDVANQLLHNPRIGKPMPDDTGRREVSTAFGKNGYVLRYKIDDEGNIVIIRVWHFLEQRQ